MQQVVPKFPKYEILGEIGHGGMGVVYKARHTGLDKLRAIKIIIPSYAADKEFLTRFNLEARRAASVEHPNIVRILDEGATEDAIPYMIMEYVEGISLDKKIRTAGCLDVDSAVTIIAQVADALDHIHECGLVHRDVKSANVLVTPAGRAVLTDFGIAHLITDTHITKTGLVIGTPEFMSPEQINGAKNIDGRSDIFSLGVVLYNKYFNVSTSICRRYADCDGRENYARPAPAGSTVPRRSGVARQCGRRMFTERTREANTNGQRTCRAVARETHLVRRDAARNADDGKNYDRHLQKTED